MIGLSTDVAAQHARGDDIDLGTATLGHMEMAAGPLRLALGLFDRFQVGTSPAGWFVGLALPGSLVGSAFVKARLFGIGRLSTSLETSAFYGRLAYEGAALSGWVVPTRLVLGVDWTDRFSTSLEGTAVFTSLRTGTSVDSGTDVEGIVMGRTIHAGLIPRLALWPWISAFARGRVLLGRAPLVIRAGARLSEGARLSIDARGDAGELTSGVAAVAGFHLHWPIVSITAAGGYGTWFIPMLDLPFGESGWIAEIDFYVRF